MCACRQRESPSSKALSIPRELLVYWLAFYRRELEEAGVRLAVDVPGIGPSMFPSWGATAARIMRAFGARAARPARPHESAGHPHE
jgi:hypothetical protein